MDDTSPKAGLGLVGAGAAACAACCAGPIVSVVAGVGVASLLGVLMFGVLGLASVMALGAVAWRRAQRRRYPPAQAALVSAPRMKQARPADTTHRP